MGSISTAEVTVEAPRSGTSSPLEHPSSAWTSSTAQVDFGHGPAASLLLFQAGLPSGLRPLVRRRLPELDLVAVRIEKPAESPIRVALRLAHDGAAGDLDLGESLIDVVDDEVEHERRRRRPEVPRARREDAPHSDGIGRHLTRLEDRAARHIQADAEGIPIPPRELPRVARPEEHAAYAQDLSHRLPSAHRPTAQLPFISAPSMQEQSKYHLACLLRRRDGRGGRLRHLPDPVGP